MNLLVEMILAAMINISPPGYSSHSQIPIEHCDEICQAQPLCENVYDFRCAKPKFNKDLFEEKIKLLSDNGSKITTAEIEQEAKYRSFTRPEKYEEGLARYRIIAEAIVKATSSINRNICEVNCNNLDCKKNCRKIAPWMGSQKDHAFLTMILMHFESGFRADVHSGFKRGDCSWRFPNGRRARENALGAKYTCRSTCLGQLQIGEADRQTKWTPDDITGIDYRSTYRCSILTARQLAFARNYCSTKSSHPNWASATLSMYGSGKNCTQSHLVHRGHKFTSVIEKSWSLNKTKLEFFKNENVKSILETLSKSENKIYWMHPVNVRLSDIQDELVGRNHTNSLAIN